MLSRIVSIKELYLGRFRDSCTAVIHFWRRHIRTKGLKERFREFHCRRTSFALKPWLRYFTWQKRKQGHCSLNCFRYFCGTYICFQITLLKPWGGWNVNWLLNFISHTTNPTFSWVQKCISQIVRDVFLQSGLRWLKGLRSLLVGCGGWGACHLSNQGYHWGTSARQPFHRGARVFSSRDIEYFFFFCSKNFPWDFFGNLLSERQTHRLFFGKLEILNSSGSLSKIHQR